MFETLTHLGNWLPGTRLSPNDLASVEGLDVQRLLQLEAIKPLDGQAGEPITPTGKTGKAKP